jgi:hypothetical protein
MAGMTEDGQYRLRLFGCAVLALLVTSMVAAVLIANMFVPFG